jgi:predicted MFS family arabinose efflux permease
VFALVEGNDKGWGSTEIVSCLTGAVVLLVGFVMAERVQERPMLDLRLLHVPAFAGASVVAFTLAGSMFALFLFVTLYLQEVLGYSPLQAGLRFLPISMLSFFVAPFAGRASGRIVPVRLLLGGGLALVGLGLLLMSAVNARSDWTVLLPGFLIAGAGIGMINPPLAETAVGVVPPERSGMASGINNTFRQVGTATGIAALGAIFEHEVVVRAQHVLAATAAGRGALASAGGSLGPALRQGGVHGLLPALDARRGAALETAYRVAFTGAFSEILAIGAAIALAGAAVAFVLVRARDFVTPEPVGAA